MSMGGASCSLNSCRELARSTHDTPGYLADTEHTHPYTYAFIHIQSFWVMGTRRCAHTLFILYGFLFECVLLTGPLMASPFPGQGSPIRPYPGHAKRAGGTRKNEVSPAPSIPPQGLFPRLIQEVREQTCLKTYELLFVWQPTHLLERVL